MVDGNDSTWTNVFEPDNIPIEISFALTGFMLLSNAFSLTVLVAFLRTRTVPKTAKFLSCGLLAFDSLGIFFLNIRRFYQGLINMHLITFGYVFCLTAYMNVTIMSCDRYLIFSRPFDYVRYEKGFRTSVAVVWFFYSFSTGIGAYVHCFSRFTDITTLSNCNIGYLTSLMKIVFPVIIILSSIFFIKVLIIIYRLKASKRCATRLREFKSTVVMMSCVANFYMVAFVLAFLVVVPVERNVKRLIADILFIVNGIFDTLAYVLVFRECRMVLIRAFGCCCRKAKDKAEEMRIEIYNIVLSAKKVSSNKISSIRCPVEMAT